MVTLRLKLKYLIIALCAFLILKFFGVFTHLFEKDFYNDFHYPYDGDVQDSVLQLRHNLKPDIAPINFYNYSYLIKSENKCKNSGELLRPRLVYIVKSAISHFIRRLAIRNSWGYEHRFSDVIIRTVFVLGMTEDPVLLDKVNSESEKFGDIIQANFVDSYYNNTIKTMMGFKWAVTYCPSSQFYMFVDDDMYVSTKNVLRFVRNPTNYPAYLKEPGFSAKKTRRDAPVLQNGAQTSPVKENTFGSKKTKRHALWTQNGMRVSGFRTEFGAEINSRLLKDNMEPFLRQTAVKEQTNFKPVVEAQIFKTPYVDSEPEDHFRASLWTVKKQAPSFVSYKAISAEVEKDVEAINGVQRTMKQTTHSKLLEDQLGIEPEMEVLTGKQKTKTRGVDFEVAGARSGALLKQSRAATSIRLKEPNIKKLSLRSEPAEDQNGALVARNRSQTETKSGVHIVKRQTDFEPSKTDFEASGSRNWAVPGVVRTTTDQVLHLESPKAYIGTFSEKNADEALRKQPRNYNTEILQKKDSRPQVEVEHQSKIVKRQVLDFDLPEDVRLYAGYVFISAPHRHKTSKWHVPLEEYPYHMWPPYVTAGSYILSREALHEMYYTSFYTQHFRFDDIYLGLVALKANIEPYHCTEFHFYKKAYSVYGYTYVISSHGYEDHDELLRVWTEQRSAGNA